MHVHMYVHIQCVYVHPFTDAPIFVDLLSYLVCACIHVSNLVCTCIHVSFLFFYPCNCLLVFSPFCLQMSDAYQKSKFLPYLTWMVKSKSGKRKASQSFAFQSNCEIWFYQKEPYELFYPAFVLWQST